MAISNSVIGPADAKIDVQGHTRTYTQATSWTYFEIEEKI